MAARGMLEKLAPQELGLGPVARAAGVTPALAHYYFGNRDGLLEALLAEHVNPRVDEMLEAARARAPQPRQAITALMQRICALLASDPVFRRCIQTSQAPAQQLRSRLLGGLHDLLLRAQRMGALRTDLTADYLATSLLGLVLCHFLEEESAALRPEAVAELMFRHIALLRDGILREGT